MKQCQTLKGVNALRFELLNNRRDTKTKKFPFELLTENAYKKYDKYGITKSQMKLILKKKCFTKQNIGQVPFSPQSVYYSICTIMSFVSHGTESNVTVKTPQMKLTMAYADKDIKKGEQLFIDYCSYVQDKRLRTKISEVKTISNSFKKTKEDQPKEE